VAEAAVQAYLPDTSETDALKDALVQKEEGQE
jgi:hypothetical protein